MLRILLSCGIEVDNTAICSRSPVFIAVPTTGIKALPSLVMEVTIISPGTFILSQGYPAIDG
jgi:hypothetical protein